MKNLLFSHWPRLVGVLFLAGLFSLALTQTGNLILNPSSEAYGQVAGTADLSLKITASPTTVGVGELLKYSITIINNGPATATGVIVTVALPPQVQAGNANATVGAWKLIDQNIIMWDIPSLPNGSIGVLTVEVKSTAVGSISNTAKVSANERDPNSGDNVATVSTLVNATPAGVAPTPVIPAPTPVQPAPTPIQPPQVVTPVQPVPGQPGGGVPAPIPPPIPTPIRPIEPPREEAVYIYSVKFICGIMQPLGPKPFLPSLSDPLPVVPGLYRTAVNIHNFGDTAVSFQKKAVVARPQDEPRGPISRKVTDKLRANEALEVDCQDIVKLLGQVAFSEDTAKIEAALQNEKDPAKIAELKKILEELKAPAVAKFIKGFVEIESTTELEVTSVYTVEELLEQGISIDVEHINPHIVKRKITTPITKTSVKRIFTADLLSSLPSADSVPADTYDVKLLLPPSTGTVGTIKADVSGQVTNSPAWAQTVARIGTCAPATPQEGRIKFQLASSQLTAGIPPIEAWVGGGIYVQESGDPSGALNCWAEVRLLDAAGNVLIVQSTGVGPFSGEIQVQKLWDPLPIAAVEIIGHGAWVKNAHLMDP